MALNFKIAFVTVKLCKVLVWLVWWNTMLRKDDCFTANTWITWLAADIDRCSANQRAIGVTSAPELPWSAWALPGGFPTGTNLETIDIFYHFFVGQNAEGYLNFHCEVRLREGLCLCPCLPVSLVRVWGPTVPETEWILRCMPMYHYNILTVSGPLHIDQPAIPVSFTPKWSVTNPKIVVQIDASRYHLSR